jgi:hypothetical protein
LLPMASDLEDRKQFAKPAVNSSYSSHHLRSCSNERRKKLPIVNQEGEGTLIEY